MTRTGLDRRVMAGDIDGIAPKVVRLIAELLLQRRAFLIESRPAGLSRAAFGPDWIEETETGWLLYTASAHTVMLLRRLAGAAEADEG